MTRVINSSSSIPPSNQDLSPFRRSDHGQCIGIEVSWKTGPRHRCLFVTFVGGTRAGKKRGKIEWRRKEAVSPGCSIPRGGG